jgi:UDP-glucose 4-epimerase
MGRAIQVKTLITGGSGFIGQAFATLLLDLGKSVVIVDRNNLTNDYLKNSSRVNFFKVDCNDYFIIEKIVRENNVSEIVHLAANSDIKSGSIDSNPDFNDTLKTSLVISQILKTCSIKSLFFSSSSAVFGTKNYPITESLNELCYPISNYGWAKLASEMILQNSSRNSDTRFLCFRFPNVVGPNPTHGILFDLKNKMDLDPKTLVVLGNGTQTKPYIHIDDLAKIFVEFWYGHATGMFNIGPNDVISVKEIVEIIISISGISPEILWGKTNSGWEGDVPNYSFESNNKNMFISKLDLNSRNAISAAVTQIWTK